MSLGSLIRKAVPVALGAVTGGLPGAFAATSAQIAQDRQNRVVKRQINERNNAIAQENARMAEIYGTGNLSSVQAPLGGSATTSSGFGSGFGSFVSDFGRNIINPISSVASSILPFFGSRDQARQPAATRRPILQGSELQTTGTNEAFVGGFGNVIGAASRFLRTPAGQIGTGLGIGGALSLGQMGAPTMRITRKTKRLAQQAYSLGMGDLGASMQIFGS
jgi:hypothetical protein